MAWWYVRRASGENVGPIDDTAVVIELDAGRLPPNGWVFQAGGAAWRRVDEVTQFSAAVHRAMEALGEAPTLYSDEAKKEQKSLAALYAAKVEGVPPQPSPSRPPGPAPAPMPIAPSPAPMPMAPAPAPMPMAPPSTLASTQPELGGPHGTAPMAAAAPPPARYELSVSGPASSAAPFVVDNPLEEARGAAGWLAIGLAAAAAVLYFMSGSASLVSLAFLQEGVVAPVLAAFFSYACAGLFAWCAAGLFRRRVRAYRAVMGLHAAIVLLIVCGVLIRAMLGASLHWSLLAPAVIVITHLLGLLFSYAGRGVFWISS